METEGLLPCSQELAAGPYPEPVASYLYLTHFPKIILILASHLRLCLPSGLFPSGFQNKILYAFLISSIRAT